MFDIRTWLDELGLGRYGDAFEHNDIDQSVLPDLTDEALEKLGAASSGHRMKLQQRVWPHHTNGRRVK